MKKENENPGIEHLCRQADNALRDVIEAKNRLLWDVIKELPNTGFDNSRKGLEAIEQCGKVAKDLLKMWDAVGALSH